MQDHILRLVTWHPKTVQSEEAIHRGLKETLPKGQEEVVNQGERRQEERAERGFPGERSHLIHVNSGDPLSWVSETKHPCRPLQLTKHLHIFEVSHMIQVWQAQLISSFIDKETRASEGGVTCYEPGVSCLWTQGSS